MTGRRRTPLQRAESRHAAEVDQDSDEFRNMMRRRQDAEAKLQRHLEGERDGRPIDDPHGAVAAGREDASEDADPGPGRDKTAIDDHGPGHGETGQDVQGHDDGT